MGWAQAGEEVNSGGWFLTREVGAHVGHSLTWWKSCFFCVIRLSKHLPLLFKKVLFGRQRHREVTLFRGQMFICIFQHL